MEEFQRFRELLYDTENITEIDETTFTSSYYKRWVRAMKNPRSLGRMDLASLIRNILRFESEKQNGESMLLKVPGEGIWPDEMEWRQFGIEVVDKHEDGYLIQAKRWMPNWLPEANDNPPDQDLFALTKRNNYAPVSGDPFLTEVGRQTYRSASQKDAIRSILSATPGSTLVVNLPTGTGKSLCAQLPGVLHGKNFGLTLVVVPTVALCIDQERAMSAFFSHPTAYYGGTEQSDVKKGIRERIMDGTQRIVFTSPESLIGSLHIPLQVAAERGFLKMFVIDEAHIVGLWGDEFRPAFQQLAGFRNYLLSICDEPFMTLLLSATISDVCLDTIETLFSKPGPFQTFSSVQLRPEPSYWVKKCENDDSKRTYLLEALAHLPRPLIIYTSKVKDANEIAFDLDDHGYTRCEIFTGDTTSQNRNKIIQQWQNRDIDIIVATSAFGLGVDQAEVRAVIHACIPENIDRFYQEIGRGGRDGCASLSLLLYTDADLRTAEGMNRTILIGVDRGMQRWQQMFSHKLPVKGKSDEFFVPINLSPGYSEKDIDMSSRENQVWNVRTLNLMSRAGLIELMWEAGSKDKEAVGSDYRLVKIIDEKHLNESRWGQVIEPIRQKSRESEVKSLNLMKQFLKGESCVSEILLNIYRISKRELPYRKEINVAIACGGCPSCRKSDLTPFANPASSNVIQWPTTKASEHDFLHTFLGDVDQRLVMFYPSTVGNFMSLPKREQHKWRMLLGWFLEQGVQHIVGNHDFLEMVQQDHMLLKDKIVFLTDIDSIPAWFVWPNVRTFVFHPVHSQLIRPFQRRLKGDHTPSLAEIYFLPDMIKDPTNQNRRLKDVLSLRHYTIDEFKLEVGLI
ncbi:protein DpdF [Bacillus sp. X1(2014)]|uniref:protein DpdF n=1 Tax=Bacillus sp. X1(2014) TaxID=1565991 RepID=UPI00119F1C76|nr:protein DpdF [Bacillus sp. X1(2014)]